MSNALGYNHDENRRKNLLCPAWEGCSHCDWVRERREEKGVGVEQPRRKMKCTQEACPTYGVWKYPLDGSSVCSECRSDMLVEIPLPEKGYDVRLTADGREVKEDGGTGYAPEDDPKFRYMGVVPVEDWGVKDISGLVHRTGRAMEFYMQLHRDKGGWKDYRDDYVWESIMRNLHEFYKAHRKASILRSREYHSEQGDPALAAEVEAAEREAVAEAIGIINHVAIMLDNEYEGQMEELVDWLPLWDKIVNNTDRKEADG